MRRYLGWIAVLALLLLTPSSAFAPGSLTIPNTLGSLSGTQPASLLDANWTTIRDYVNNREVSSGTLAARPAASIAGRWYFATDVSGGTLYFDTGATWTQVSPGVTGLALADQITGCTLSNGAAGNTLGISVCGVASDDAVIANRIFMTVTSAYTKTTATWAVGTGNGCLDTGAVAANTWYHTFVIQRTDTNITDYLCSTNATAPTMPTNYTRRRRIGSLRTATLSELNIFTQYGDSFIWATASDLNVASTNPGTAAVTATAATPNGVITEAILNVLITPGSSNNLLVYVSPLTAADQAPITTGSPLGTGPTSQTTASGTPAVQVRVWTDTSRQFRFRLNVSGALDVIRMTTVGWVDPRGRG